MYRIIDDGSSEIVEKKSRFLGFAISVDSAEPLIRLLRLEKSTMTHGMSAMLM